MLAKMLEISTMKNGNFRNYFPNFAKSGAKWNFLKTSCFSKKSVRLSLIHSDFALPRCLPVQILYRKSFYGNRVNYPGTILFCRGVESAENEVEK